MGLKKINFIEPNNSIVGRLFRLFGVELSQEIENGYFHRFGYSGKQKDNNFDILVVEKEDGRVVLVPNDNKYYEFIMDH